MTDLRITDAPELTVAEVNDSLKIPTGGYGNYSITMITIRDWLLNYKMFATQSYVDTEVGAVTTALNNHTARVDNPHQVTKSQVGLGNVDNTSDLNKPISSATQTALTNLNTSLTAAISVKANAADVYTKSEVYTKVESDNKYHQKLSIDGILAPTAVFDDVKNIDGVNGTPDLIINQPIQNLANRTEFLKIHNNLFGRDSTNTHPASSISYGSGSVGDFLNDQQEINNIQKKKSVHVLDFGMKMDGSDETAKLNEIISSLDNCRLIIGGGNLTLSKTSLYAERFPNNDQPCIPILDKVGFTIEVQEGTTISTNVHAQGVFEIQNSIGTWIVNNGTIQGAGDFPPIDGNTGYGEKGISGKGYATSGFWGYRKNNSFDTSGNTTGGFGGAFPQYGGGTASTWGMWKGGYIGNQGFGVLIHNNSRFCGVVGTGLIKGFNGAAVEIGFHGDFNPTNLGYPKSIGCIVQGIRIEDNYSMGVAFLDCEGCTFRDLKIRNIGHPLASYNHNTVDPGYGITSIGSIYSLSRGCSIVDCEMRFCKRKGIDSHGSYDLLIQNNLVEDCTICGIFAVYTNATSVTTGTRIIGNTIRRCGYMNQSSVVSSLGAIYTQGIATGDKLDSVIRSNIIEDCFGYYAAITSRIGVGVEIIDNTIRGVHPQAAIDGNTHILACIQVGGTAANIAMDDVTVKDNDVYLNSTFTQGISSRYGSGLIKNNEVYIPTGLTSPIGIYHLGTSASVFDYVDNFVNAKSGLAYSINQTLGLTTRNIYRVSDAGQSGNPRNLTTNLAVAPLLVTITVTFNGTDTPSVVVTNGADLFDAVVASDFGLRVNLKSIQTSDKISALVPFPTSSGGIATSTPTAINFIYLRTVGANYFEFGFKGNSTQSTHFKTSDIATGSLKLDFLITK